MGRVQPDTAADYRKPTLTGPAEKIKTKGVAYGRNLNILIGEDCDAGLFLDLQFFLEFLPFSRETSNFAVPLTTNNDVAQEAEILRLQI